GARRLVLLFVTAADEPVTATIEIKAGTYNLPPSPLLLREFHDGEQSEAETKISIPLGTRISLAPQSVVSWELGPTP
ncbi:MAG: hypothetical protein N3G20_00100, partial [Verrucomicrobiae bacterium]|nr:hypothetical protein [Verrucomicrobiae bacterium]